MPSECAEHPHVQAVSCTSLGINNYSALFSPPRSDTIQGRPPPSHGGGRPLFCAAWLKHGPWRGALRRRQPCELMLARGSPFFERSHRRLRLGASRHRRTRALKRHAMRPAIPHCNFIIRIPKTATTDRRSFNRTTAFQPCFRRELRMHSSFGSERITAFFRHHGPGNLGNLPSRQYALVQKGPQTALRDIDAARFQHFMHLSHRNPLGLLLDQSLPQTVQHIRQAQLRRHKFRQFPSMASKSISASLKRFAGIFRLSPPFQGS